MTNKDKFLRDGVSVEELAKDITKFIADGYPDSFIFPKSIENYFKAEVTPTLTEDERVILRNIPKEYKYISKQIETGDLFITEKKDGMGIGICIYEFNPLFQFIQERRRIRDKGAIGGKIMDLKFRDRYIKAQTALQEILDSDKTVDNITVYIGKNRKVIITLDLMGSPADNEKIVTKIHNFIPDFALELLEGETNE